MQTTELSHRYKVLSGGKDAFKHDTLQSNEEEERPERISLLNSSSLGPKRPGPSLAWYRSQDLSGNMPPVELLARIHVNLLGVRRSRRSMSCGNQKQLLGGRAECDTSGQCELFQCTRRAGLQNATTHRPNKHAVELVRQHSALSNVVQEKCGHTLGQPTR